MENTEGFFTEPHPSENSVMTNFFAVDIRTVRLQDLGNEKVHARHSSAKSDLSAIQKVGLRNLRMLPRLLIPVNAKAPSEFSR